VSLQPDSAERRFAEATALRDTHENRKRVEHQAEIIGAEIRAGTFDYLKWFANGNRAAESRRWRCGVCTNQGSRADTCTIAPYYGDRRLYSFPREVFGGSRRSRAPARHPTVFFGLAKLGKRHRVQSAKK
jgi:hypothetical protein